MEFCGLVCSGCSACCPASLHFSLKEDLEEYKADLSGLLHCWEPRNTFFTRAPRETPPLRNMSDLLDDGSFMFTSESVGEGHPGESSGDVHPLRVTRSLDSIQCAKVFWVYDALRCQNSSYWTARAQKGWTCMCKIDPQAWTLKRDGYFIHSDVFTACYSHY